MLSYKYFKYFYKTVKTTRDFDDDFAMNECKHIAISLNVTKRESFTCKSNVLLY